MIVEQDVDARATYISLTEGEVARTVSIGDLIMVDLDKDGDVVGVELLVTTHEISSLPRDDLLALANAYPVMVDLVKAIL